MKNYKYIALLFASLVITSCTESNDMDEIVINETEVELNTGNLDLSNYVSIGASFTAGFTDNALFKAAQENSFPNILASKFGTTFRQPLMNDNIGGLLYRGEVLQGPRLVFDGAGPTPIDARPTTNAGFRAGVLFNNYGIPGAKSFHLVTPGYGNRFGIASGRVNPYFARMASSADATVLGDAMAQAPTFFTLSEVGGNDVLGYALSGGSGQDQTGNLNAATYGPNDITDPTLFASVFSNMVSTLTSTGAKGVVGNVPYITNLAHFTSVPHNPIEGSAIADQVPLLNQIFGAINQIYAAVGESERAITFSATGANPIVVFDEDATDLTQAIAQTLGASPTFAGFVQSLGLPAQAAPLVAGLLGQQFGKARSATPNDLFVLPSSSVIGQVNTNVMQGLMAQGIPQALAGQFAIEGVTLPLGDRWALTPQEQQAIKTATDAYNSTIEGIAASNPDVALVDLKGILEEASAQGVQFGEFRMTTSLVTGGLVSLDGVHLTARGYALMANKILEAMDANFGSNFTSATNGLAEAKDYPTNYSPVLR